MENNETLKVQGFDSLYRDPNTNCIINANELAYKEYLIRRKHKNKEEERVEKIEYDMNLIKNDLCEIKHILKILINKEDINGSK